MDKNVLVKDAQRLSLAIASALCRDFDQLDLTAVWNNAILNRVETVSTFDPRRCIKRGMRIQLILSLLPKMIKILTGLDGLECYLPVKSSAPIGDTRSRKGKRCSNWWSKTPRVMGQPNNMRYLPCVMTIFCFRVASETKPRDGL